MLRQLENTVTVNRNIYIYLSSRGRPVSNARFIDKKPLLAEYLHIK